MKKCLLFITFILMTASTGYAELPKADISFLCFDLKYNQKDGVKICEMQQGMLSGYPFHYDGWNMICPAWEKFCQRIKPYNSRHWIVTEHLTNLYKMILDQKNEGTIHWIQVKSDALLPKDKHLRKKKFMQPDDPYHIEDYHGLVVRGHLNEFSPEEFHKNYPGILLLNEAFYPHHNGNDVDDKYKASLLFSGDERLERFKPQWELYPKKFSSQLVDEILDNFSNEMLVIKPQSGSRGRGVLIIVRDELEDTLSYIFNESPELRKNKDQSYNYWFYDENSHFLVEEYIPSDPITFPHLGDDGHYDGTMRVGVCLIYHDHAIDFHFLDGIWKIPLLPIEGEGTLNQKHKSTYRPGYTAQIDSETQMKIERELSEALSILYRKLVAN